MKRIVLTTLLISFILSVCGGKSDADIQTTVQTSAAQTQQAKKTPLADINLEPALFQQGDLPSQYESGQITYYWEVELPKPVKPKKFVIQKVGRYLNKKDKKYLVQGFGQEYLLIALFESATDLDTTYNAALGSYKKRRSELDFMPGLDRNNERTFVPAEIGDKAQFTILDFVAGRTFLVFTRCNALVVVDVNVYGKFQSVDGRVRNTIPTDEVVSFGQRIDKRLKPLVCQP